MKKFLVPLFFFLFLSCSEDIDLKYAASAQDRVSYCEIENQCVKDISESVCTELGKEITFTECDELGSSLSSSSDNGISSSSSSSATNSSSSYTSSSSSSSSKVNSSSSKTVSSSSNGLISSSSNNELSSSSIENTPSSSSESSQEPLAWSECSIPPYVGKDEPIANLKFISIENNNDRCSITYTLNNSIANATDLNYSGSAVGTNQTLSITATAACNGVTITPNSKTCSKTVTVADYVKFTRTGDPGEKILQSGKTIVDVDEESAHAFGCQARDSTGDPNPFRGETSFILNAVTASVTEDEWWVKTPISDNRMLFESNNLEVGSYRCQIEN